MADMTVTLTARMSPMWRVVGPVSKWALLSAVAIRLISPARAEKAFGTIASLFVDVSMKINDDTAPPIARASSGEGVNRQAQEKA